MKSIVRRRAAVTVGFVAGLLTVAAPFDNPAEAGTSVVVNRADDGSATSLRAAVDAANADGGDWVIELQPGAPYVIDRLCLNGNLDDNHGGDLDLNTNANIRFSAPVGTVATIEVRCTGERVVDHHGTGEVRFDRIRLTGGNTANGANGNQMGDLDASSAEHGGAVRSEGHVQLILAIVEGNRTGNGGNGAPSLAAAPGGRGGEGGSGAAIAADTIGVAISVIRDNRAGNGGNGANGATMAGGRGGSGGGQTLRANAIEITASQVEGNTAGHGGNGGSGQPGGDGGFGGRGGGASAELIEVYNSTIAGNQTGNGGRGGAGLVGTPGGDGGGAGSGGGTTSGGGRVIRSTIHGNATGSVGLPGAGTPAGTSVFVGEGGGVLYSSGENENEIAWSTITGNTALIGSNLSVFETTVSFSVIGEGIGSSNCEHTVTLGAFAIFDDASCAAGATVIAPFGLGPLGMNGGRTTTRLPQPGSPLIGLIPLASCGDPDSFDQRTEARPNGACEPGAIEVPPPDASKFVPVPPRRVFDTREPGPAAGYIAGGTTRTVQFAGVAGIPPTGVTAVAINLTIDSAGGAGFVTAHEAGQPRPLASSLNTVSAGQTIPNMVIVPLSPDGRVSFFVQTGGHLLADVLGYFVATPVASDGRIVPLPPARLFDTREPGPVAGKVPAGGSITVDVTGVAGVPASGVVAVVVNVTGTEATGRGFVTTHPGGQPRPLASTLNLDGPGHTAANLTIVPVGADGTITLYSQSGAHLLADVTGYVTDASAVLTSYGLFVPIDPLRLFDTRTTATAVPAGGTIHQNSVRGEIADNASAVVLNLTATEAAAPGFFTAFPLGIPRPLASTLNVTRAGETRPNAAILPVGDGGQISFFSQSGAHLLADAYGYLLPEAPTVGIAI